MKKNIAFLSILIAGLLPVLSYSDEHAAASLSPSSIQKAVNAASPGDTVVLPAGDYSGFNDTVLVPNGVSLRGQGKEKTILRNTSGAIFLFIWNYYDTTSSYKVSISGFKLIGHGDSSGSGIELNNMLDFAVFDIMVRDFGGVGVASQGTLRGVIYNSDFINIRQSDLSGTGYGVGVHGDGIWDDPKPPLGTKNAVFIEDCYFSGCKHGISSNVDSHYVVRYNRIEGLKGFGVDAHGKQPAWPCGSNTYEIYKNTITGSGLASQDDNGIVVRGGSGVIYDNKIYKCDEGWRPSAIGISIDSHTAYPDRYQVRDCYIWGNTHNDLPYTDIFVSDDAAPFVKLNREYFLQKKTGYVPYPYPHPLRGTSTPLMASVTASPLSGMAPLTVSFAGAAAGGIAPYSYSWNFGDGGTSTTQNLSHTYRSIGTFGATLTVRDSQGASDSDTVSITVTSVPANLTAIGSASPISGKVPLYVKFSGQGSGGVPPYAYRWNFGDQTNWGVQNPSHTYDLPGSYVATLYLTDNQNATATATVTITAVSTPPALVASASASPLSGLAPLTVNFTGGATGGIAPYSYRWNFGDGYASTAQKPSHTFQSVGSYNVVLTVEDGLEALDTASISISVSASNSYSLVLSAQTGAPAPGQGGTTSPAPGTYSYAKGSVAQLRALSNTDYRFSRWTGTIASANMFSSSVSTTMDRNRTIASNFCTKCGDVNGDLKITPADAQAAFDLFLGKMSNPTLCESENADVNGSGTASVPGVTPADAQSIFNKYLKRAELESDCSGRARTTAAGPFLPVDPLGTVGLAVHETFGERGEELVVPVIVDSLLPMGAFGFELSFPSPGVAFVGLEYTDATSNFIQVGAQRLEPGVVRVGGYAVQPIYPAAPYVLVTLIFRINRRIPDLSVFSILATYDDLLRVRVLNDVIPNNIPQRERLDKRPGKKDPRY